MPQPHTSVVSQAVPRAAGVYRSDVVYIFVEVGRAFQSEFLAQPYLAPFARLRVDVLQQCDVFD